MVCLSADRFAGNLLENSGAPVKRSRLEGRNGILMWEWKLEYLDRLWNHVETKGHQQQRRQQQQLHRTLRHNLTVMNPRCVDKERTQKHSGSELSGRTLGCPACETPGPGESHTRERKTYQDA